MVKVKICGITNIEDASFCSSEGADALGFIFWKKSPRYVTPRIAKKIIDQLLPFISTVGVFVDEDKTRVIDIASHLKLDILQFHGSESDSYCKFFKPYFRVIKTFFPQRKTPDVHSYKVDAYLFDVKWEEKQKGNSTIGGNFLKRIKAFKDRPVILSGGLTPKNVSCFVKKMRPYAVDVARGIEVFPGKKDRDLVRLFIKKAKSI